MQHSAEMRRCLIECDVEQIRKLWQHISPHLPQPQDDNEALVQIHAARTQCESIPFKYRAYSHAWLTDNQFPSLLPDHLRPRAERMYPRVVSAVGVAVHSIGGHQTDYQRAVQQAMSDVVADHYADGIEDPVIIKPRMMEVRLKLRKQR